MVKLTDEGLLKPIITNETKNKINKNIKFPRSIKKLINILEFVDHHRIYRKYAPYNKKIQKFYKIHKGERCFIVGTGPSLNKTNLSLIKKEILFGVNTLFRGLDKFKINPKYWVISDPVLLEAHYKHLLNLDTKMFISGGASHMYINRKNEFLRDSKLHPIPIRRLGRGTIKSDFSKDLVRGVYYSGTVIYHALQIAYYMGFETVYLLGCDCDYSGLPRFDGKGTVRSEPPILSYDSGKRRVFEGYERAKIAFEKDGRKIYNSTAGGKLEVFERMALEQINNLKK